ncbi:sigma-70 region 4 domain-containing protein [Moorena sp. SIO4E2]|uniref:sigma-70 region 4 domain-containing protein n=1 Tax=Moorena sp. SIO4E2 TaxID=2607826 RepID=UPI00257F75A0|nr:MULTISPECIES: sigma-70 region 4 domain-containing protein [unclassified Moorena]
MPHQHQLSPDQEQIFLLSFASEMEYQEIASQLKTSRELWRKPMSQIYMILIILWNRHLGGMGIWLWNGHLDGTGILMEWASGCETGILPVTIPRRAGCPPH